MRTPSEQAAAVAIIKLMRGVVYRDSDESTWADLSRETATVRAHFAAIGVDVVIDDAEGYAYLRTGEEVEGAEPLPRLVMRRALTYNVSLMLVLLRKRLAEFEAGGGEGKLVVGREAILEMLRMFLPESTNDARVVDQVDTTIRKCEELGFLRRLRGQSDHWEVRRVLKAYVDAQTLADFAGTLSAYSGSSAAPNDSEES